MSQPEQFDEHIFRTMEESWKKLRFFENALSFSADHIFIFDNMTRFLYINSAGAEALGVDPDRIIGKEWLNLKLPSKSLEPFDSRLKAVYAAGKPIKGEIEYSTDGESKFYEYTLNPIVNKEGDVESVIAISRDITKRKLAEEALSENDYYNRSLLRLYKSLGRAATYTQIVEALRPEIRETLNYNSVFLQIAKPEEDELLMLNAGGPAVKVTRDLMKATPEFIKKIGDEEFLVLPIKEDPFVEATYKSTDIFIVEDALTHPLTSKKVVNITKNRTMVMVPLILADKKLGYFSTGTFGDEGVLVPSSRQLDYLRALSNHVAVAVDRVRFVTERKEREKELEEDNYYNSSLLRLYKSLGQATTYKEIIETLRPEMLKTTGFKSVHLYLIRGNYEEMLLLDIGGPQEEGIKRLMNMDPKFQTKIGNENFLIMPINEWQYLQELAHAKDVYIVEDVMTHPLTDKKIGAALGYQHSVVVVPLVLAEKKYGFFALTSIGDEGIIIPNPRQVDYLRTLSNHVAVALDRVRFVTECSESEKELQKELKNCRQQRRAS